MEAPVSWDAMPRDRCAWGVFNELPKRMTKVQTATVGNPAPAAGSSQDRTEEADLGWRCETPGGLEPVAGEAWLMAPGLAP